ncbi:MAG: HdeD family acid-resistance protein [Oscillospiraceae bacterium]
MNKRSGFGWLELIVGILLIILGIFTLVNPGSALTGVIIIYGLLAIVTGIADIVFYVKMERHTGFGPTVSLISGLLSVMAGVMLLVYPGAVKWILALLVPIWFIAHCISRLTHLNVIRITAGKFYYYFSLVINILGLILGFLMLFKPVVSLLSFGLIIGVYLILLGIDSIVTAVSKTGSQW